MNNENKQLDEEISYGLAPHKDRVIWEMEYNGKKEIIFERELALASLLIDEVIFLNSYWWEKSWPEKSRKSFAVGVICNDIFSWACADAELLQYDELQDLYEHYLKDKVWGGAIWCIKKRKQMPQRPVMREIEKQGIWDLKQIKKEFNLKDSLE